MEEMWEIPERRYTVPTNHSPSPLRRGGGVGNAAEDLHAWSIYRQNLNSDFTDSALGSEERSPLPYGNFQLRDATVQSILRHPRLAPRSELGSNMYAYLKFGLPRVFPPSANNGHSSAIPMRKENSSGYDSAEDRHGSPMNPAGRRSAPPHTLPIRPARSETDLRDGLVRDRFGPPNANNRERRLRATSETNLMARNSHPSLSKAGSQVSLVSRGGAKGFYSGHTEDTIFKHPHLQVRGLCYEIGGKVTALGKGRIIDGLTFDLRGGEIMALIATTRSEGTAVLDVLSGRRHERGRIGGELLLNGNNVTASRLGGRVAYVRRDSRLHPDMTVAQTMRFHAMLRTPIISHSSLSKSATMESLLEDLGLGSVRESLVETLTTAERQRLSVACQLLLNTEILLLDDPTRGMDIFDTFFLVEYVREWGRRGRIVIMTIQPPTFEIFSMFNKVGLLSTGRLMFYGDRKEMLPYFAFIEYPCPGFKNPSDYYLDLVTLDDLSGEALLESSQRIETLADSYRRKMEPLSEPGPPAPLPPRPPPAGFFKQIGAIWMYTLVFTFPWNVVRWLSLMIFSASISILIGAIFWDVRGKSDQDQNSASDRLGQHWAMLAIAPWPILLTLVSRDIRGLPYITRDSEEGLYSKGLYFIAKLIVEIPFITSIFLAYIIPAYVMAGIGTDEREMTNFYLFIGYMVLHLYGLRSLLLSLILIFRDVVIGGTVSGIIFFCLSLSAGYSLHKNDLGEWVYWVRAIAPSAWLLQPIAKHEFALASRFDCPKNPVINTDLIMVKADCGVGDGKTALEWWGLSESWPSWIPVLASFAFVFVFLIVGMTGFILRRHAPPIPPPDKP